MEEGRESNLRLLAPAAVVVFALLLLVVLLTSGVFSPAGSGSSDEAASGSRSADGSARKHDRGRRTRGRATYTVRAGDTLGSIASRNGTTVDRILELNPQLDPQSLTAGQRIRLRD
jgi:LysM repeat protein